MPIHQHIIGFIYILSLLTLNSLSLKGAYSQREDLPSSISQCLKNQGHDQLALFLPTNEEGVLASSLTYTNIGNARKAGLKVSVVFTPCRVHYPQQVSYDLAKKFSEYGIDRFWIAPSFNLTLSKYCDWVDSSQRPFFPPSFNCKFLDDITKQLKNSNIPYGILSNEKQWKAIFDNCLNFRDSPLYWYPLPVTEDPTLMGYVSFGGWVSPRMKIYSDRNMCGAPLLYSNIFTE